MKKIENSECLGKDFGSFIRTARERKDMFQSEVAELVGITQPYYSLIERGERVVDFVLALKICKVLQIDIRDFIAKYM